MTDQSEYTTTSGYPVPACDKCGEELFLKMIQVCVACEDKAAGQVVISREDAEMILDYAVTAEAARVDTKDEEAAIDRLRAALKENNDAET